MLGDSGAVERWLVRAILLWRAQLAGTRHYVFVLVHNALATLYFERGVSQSCSVGDAHDICLQERTFKVFGPWSGQWRLAVSLVARTTFMRTPVDTQPNMKPSKNNQRSVRWGKMVLSPQAMNVEVAWWHDLMSALAMRVFKLVKIISGYDGCAALRDGL